MITGTVSPNLEAIIAVTICGRGAVRREVNAIVDTGFNDFLTLPRAIIEDLKFPFQAPVRATLADGSTIVMEYYRATVIWDGQERDIPVLAADGDPLVGMSLLRDQDLKMQVVENGSVTIEARS